MGKEYLNGIFGSLTNNKAWSLQVLKINKKNDGISYICKEIEIEPITRTLDFIESIKDYYCSDEGIDSFVSVDDYSGDMVNNVIYKLKKDNKLISSNYKSLLESSALSDKDDIVKDKPNAAIYKGIVNISGKDTAVLLISMQTPFSSLSNKFLWTKKAKFKEIDTPVLTLRKKIDVAIIGGDVYFFSLSGEKLFDMDRTYKKVSMGIVEKIAKCDFISDVESFKSIANSGINPRRFVAYNEKHFDWLKDNKKRKKIAKKFGIIMDGDVINTNDKESVDKLVRFLCNKAMVDPCDNSPVEVAATKPWR